MFDEEYPYGIRGYDKAIYLTELTDEAITVMTERAPEKRDHATFMPIFALHGAVTEIPDDATAYGGLRTPAGSSGCSQAPPSSTPPVHQGWC